jgi:hypothetical protein
MATGTARRSRAILRPGEEAQVKTHYLKTWPSFFEDVAEGRKTFEVRINDRDFAVGDEIVLVEYDPFLQQLTGREIHQRITYILEGRFGLPANLCVMQLGEIP